MYTYQLFAGRKEIKDTDASTYCTATEAKRAGAKALKAIKVARGISGACRVAVCELRDHDENQALLKALHAVQQRHGLSPMIYALAELAEGQASDAHIEGYKDQVKPWMRVSRLLEQAVDVIDNKLYTRVPEYRRR